MDVRYVNPFVVSVKHTFATMLSTSVSLGKPLAGTAEQSRADVSAVVGLSGDALGRMVMSFSMDSAQRIASRFAAVPLTMKHPDFADAMGELANIVAGQAKAKLEGLNCSISLPSVIVGLNHIISHSRSKPRLSLPCQSELGDFMIEISIVSEK